jgi:hypothetical protein
VTRPNLTPEPRTAKATEAYANRCAERAVLDPIRLRQVARQFRAARARGLVDGDGNVVEQAARAS